MKKPGLVVFDMDGTLTESRGIIHSEMRKTLENLPVMWAVISGARESQIAQQIPIEGIAILGQNGNEHFVKQSALPANLRKYIGEHIQKVKVSGFLDPWAIDAQGLPFDIVEDRGSQVSLSLVGHHAPRGVKKKFDPNGAIRRKVLTLHPIENDEVVALIGGTTCLDYTKKGWDKGSNIKQYAKEVGVAIEDVVYFGDQFYDGGNDVPVRGVCKCIEVKDWQDTIEKLRAIGL